eukprot:2769362-Pyramimonas_sp.AAC.1
MSRPSAHTPRRLMNRFLVPLLKNSAVVRSRRRCRLCRLRYLSSFARTTKGDAWRTTVGAAICDQAADGRDDDVT